MKISFQNGHSLHLIKSDSSLPDGANCYIITGKDQKKMNLNGKPGSVKSINRKQIINENYHYFKDASNAIRKAVSTTDCYVIYEENDIEIASVFFHIILINPLKPENNLSIAQ